MNNNSIQNIGPQGFNTPPIPANFPQKRAAPPSQSEAKRQAVTSSLNYSIQPHVYKPTPPLATHATLPVAGIPKFTFVKSGKRTSMPALQSITTGVTPPAPRPEVINIRDQNGNLRQDLWITDCGCGMPSEKNVIFYQKMANNDQTCPHCQNSFERPIHVKSIHQLNIALQSTGAIQKPEDSKYSERQISQLARTAIRQFALVTELTMYKDAPEQNNEFLRQFIKKINKYYPRRESIESYLLSLFLLMNKYKPVFEDKSHATHIITEMYMRIQNPELKSNEPIKDPLVLKKLLKFLAIYDPSLPIAETILSYFLEKRFCLNYVNKHGQTWLSVASDSAKTNENFQAFIKKMGLSVTVQDI